MHLATLVAGSLEAALGHLLKYHPDARPLADCQGQVIELQLAELPWPLYLIMADPILVYSRYGGDSQAQLNVSLSVLAAIQAGEPLSELVKQQKLEISGDMQLVGKLTQLLSQIEPDLTEPLSKLVGDGMAYRMHSLGKSLFDLGRQQLQAGGAHLSDYLIEERQVLPGPSEVSLFCQQVDELQQRAEALLDRLTALEKRHEP
ncbi:SCP2 domain-containing protein [Ferrimonas sp. SCSIO 43195]|uniref:ubiquinone biosynthesis accessory factor UbiJ n=1 Tax=Ferrimonas sp. SCSIO 43195 TaxID=2822844 RepID=UPI0020754B8B|nr:SCP2 sterol-binding domain-containing protein [Ferrimonas sp. SCSIO 43195]USD37341.1 SCP2 sterol-binding domain-containing protein [Ferrimonas sp. SCSIO 43195]